MVERGSTTFTSPPASSKAAPAKRAPDSGALAHSLVLRMLADASVFIYYSHDFSYQS